jgi:hypothetical protein
MHLKYQKNAIKYALKMQNMHLKCKKKRNIKCQKLPTNNLIWKFVSDIRYTTITYLVV